MPDNDKNRSAKDPLPLQGYVKELQGSRGKEEERLRALQKQLEPALGPLYKALKSGGGLDEAVVRKMMAAVAAAPEGAREQLEAAFQAAYAPSVSKALGGADSSALHDQILKAAGIPTDEFVPGLFLTGGRGMRGSTETETGESLTNDQPERRK